MNIRTLGIDLAKNVFRVHGVDGRGKTVVQRELRRRQLLSFIARLQPCLVGMEACGGAHYWARKIEQLGHRVRLMSPRFVKPYRKSDKNDANDAEAICEAVSRPSMRFVPIKSEAQHEVQALHRVREQLLKSRWLLPPWWQRSEMQLSSRTDESGRFSGPSSPSRWKESPCSSVGRPPPKPPGYDRAGHSAGARTMMSSG